MFSPFAWHRGIFFRYLWRLRAFHSSSEDIQWRGNSIKNTMEHEVHSCSNFELFGYWLVKKHCTQDIAITELYWNLCFLGWNSRYLFKIHVSQNIVMFHTNTLLILNNNYKLYTVDPPYLGMQNPWSQRAD